MKRWYLAVVALGLVSLMMGLAGTAALAQNAGNGTPSGEMAGTPANGETTIYHATLTPLNASVTGMEASGEATFTITGDNLAIDITVKGVVPDIQHLQHFHGFADTDQRAVCPPADADKNGDGVIDILETEPYVGVTMVPFQADPVSMKVVTDTYPTANADGSYTYHQTVSLDALTKAFLEQFPEQTSLALDHRVVMIHGIESSTTLPTTVQSLGDIPAQVTIPVACGVIEQVQPATPVPASPMATP